MNLNRWALTLFCLGLLGAVTLAQAKDSFADKCATVFQDTLAIADGEANTNQWLYDEWTKQEAKNNPGKRMGSYELWKTELIERYRIEVGRLPLDCCPLPRRPQCECNLVTDYGKDSFNDRALAQGVKACDPYAVVPELEQVAQDLVTCMNPDSAVEANWQGIFEARGHGWCETFPEESKCVADEKRNVAKGKSIAPVVKKDADSEGCKEFKKARDGYNARMAAAEKDQIRRASYESPLDGSRPAQTVPQESDGLGSIERAAPLHADPGAEVPGKMSPPRPTRATAPLEKVIEGNPIACGETEASGSKEFTANRYYEIYVVEGDGRWEIAKKDAPGAKCKGVLLSKDESGWGVRGELLGSVKGPGGKIFHSEILGALLLPKFARGGLAPNKVNAGNLYWILNLADGTPTFVAQTCSAQGKVNAAMESGRPLMTTVYVKPNPNSKEFEMVNLDFHFEDSLAGEFTIGTPNVAMDRSPAFAVGGGIAPAADAGGAL